MTAFVTLNIFSRIKNYIQFSKELQESLSKNPEDAIKFQKVFNLTVDRIYQDILNFEKANIEKFETDIYRVKKIFEKRYRNYFLYGDYIKWVFRKPFGYSGDFKIIDDIYRNQIKTNGFDGLWDSWFQQLAITESVRMRKDDFKKFILNFVKKQNGRKLRFMNLACGPAREIKELLNYESLFSDIVFDCYDIDVRAISYAKQLLNNPSNVNFFQKNAIRLALKKNIEAEIPHKYDLIYSTGLFDYLDARIAARLVSNLRKLLKNDGILLISNVGSKYNDSSSIWMEWIGEWYLIYRTEAEFAKIFIDAGFIPKSVEILWQPNKVMQYCLARK